MKLTTDIWLVGGGAFGISSPGDCHVYVISSRVDLALIDTGCGDETARIVQNMVSDGLDPSAIRYLLLTHAHRDHSGGCARLREILIERFLNTRAQFVASEETARLLAQGTAEELGLNLLGFDRKSREEALPLFEVNDTAAPSAELVLGRLRIAVIGTPGHSADSVSYRVALGQGPALSSGDAINIGGYINTGNWPGCNIAEYQEGIANLARLDVEALLPGPWPKRRAPPALR